MRSLLLFLLIAPIVPPVQAQSTNSLALRRVGTGFNLPVFATAPVGDTNRLFVIEQHTGRIRVLNLATGSIATNAFLTISGITIGGEQGLLGLAFHPGYATNGQFYVNYTTSGLGAAGHTEIVRFQVTGDPLASQTVDPTSKTVLLTYPQPESNHNAGWLAFGRDGYLYIAAGDGGGGDDRHGTFGNAQNRSALLGKILRLDVDHGSPYAVPADNPFANQAGMTPEIWAFGLRNPWRCSFDRATGDLWIGDVGQSTREEIDFAPAAVGGLNFGWRPREGSVQNPTYPNETPVTPATAPVHDYGRSSGFSVIGGYVYRGHAIPEFQGSYLFGDYGSGRFWSFRYDGTNKTDFVERTAELNSGTPKPIGSFSSFGEDAAGEIYLCDLADGEIYKLIPSQPAPIRVSEPGIAGTVFTFQFNAGAGQSYIVETRSALSEAWQPLTNITGTAVTPLVRVTDPLVSGTKFYRVRTL